nr:flavin reductase [Streptomyces sp. NBC_00857]
MITVKDLQPHPLVQVHQLIEPGPVILVTRHRGIPNVMTNGFNMMVRHAPPLIACTIGPWDHSYQALVETGECVITSCRTDRRAGTHAAVRVDRPASLRNAHVRDWCVQCA